MDSRKISVVLLYKIGIILYLAKDVQKVFIYIKLIYNYAEFHLVSFISRSFLLKPSLLAVNWDDTWKRF